MTSISDSWQTIQSNQANVETCSDITACTRIKRVQLILATFKQYFLTKYIYGDNGVDGKVDFVEDIFMDIIMRTSSYSASELVNDWEHIKVHHVKASVENEENAQDIISNLRTIIDNILKDSYYKTQYFHKINDYSDSAPK